MSASPEQLHELLTYCINFAQTMLEKAGDFYPFGATLSPAGKVGAVGGYTGEERPNPQEIYKLLSGGFLTGGRSGQYAAVALAANVNIPFQYSPPYPDGLRVHLESEGYARFIYVPYKLGSKGIFLKARAVQFEKPISVQINPSFFVGAGNG